MEVKGGFGRVFMTETATSGEMVGLEASGGNRYMRVWIYILGGTRALKMDIRWG